MQFLHRPTVARHQADTDFQIFRFGGFGQFQHLLGRGAISGERLLHENIQAFIDGVTEMHPAKRERCGEDCDVAGFQEVHSFLVTVEADEFSVGGNVHFVLMFAGQAIITVAQLVFEHVCHRDEFDRSAGGGECIRSGSGAASSAANEGNLNGFIAGGMHMWQGHTGQSGCGRKFSSGFYKFATVGQLARGIVHITVIPTIREVNVNQRN